LRAYTDFAPARQRFLINRPSCLSRTGGAPLARYRALRFGK
jgi:hypothetical protein